MAARPRARARKEISAAIEAEAVPMQKPLTSVSAAYNKSRTWVMEGRMMSMRDLVEAARCESEASLHVVTSIRDNEDVPAIVRLTAAGMVWDRGFGRAHQSIAIADLTTPGKLDLSAFSADELRDFERLLTKATADKPAPKDVTPPKPSRGVVPDTD